MVCLSFLKYIFLFHHQNSNLDYMFEQANQSGKDPQVKATSATNLCALQIRQHVQE